MGVTLIALVPISFKKSFSAGVLSLPNSVKDLTCICSIVVSISLFFFVSFCYKLEVAVVWDAVRQSTIYGSQNTIFVAIKTTPDARLSVSILYHPVLLSFVFDYIFHVNSFKGFVVL